jgi:hypothetical protein
MLRRAVSVLCNQLQLARRCNQLQSDPMPLALEVRWFPLQLLDI